jgi:hypothetical protein
MTSLSFGATKQPVECSFDAAIGLLLIPLFRLMPSGADAQMIDSARQSGGSSVPSKLPEQIFFPVATPRPAYEAVIDRRRWTISFRAIALARRAQHEDPRTRNAKGGNERDFTKQAAQKIGDSGMRLVDWFVRQIERKRCRNQNQQTDLKATQVSRTVSADLSAHFLRLVDLGKGAFELLGRYEVSLWRQMRQTLFTLDVQISDVNTQPFYRQQSTGA